MLGPEASLKAKLRFETRVVELLEETAKNLPRREEPDPSATSVNCFDRRTRLCTKHSCDDNTSIMVTNEMQRLFFIGIFVHETIIFLIFKGLFLFLFFFGIFPAIVCFGLNQEPCLVYIQKIFVVRTVKRFPRGPLRVAFLFDF